MRIAFSSEGDSWDSMVDPRFGRARYLLLLDEATNELTAYDNSANCAEAHGAGPKTAQSILDKNPQVLITGNGPGRNADTVLSAGGIQVYVGAGRMTIKEAYEAYKQDTLTKNG